MKGFLRKSILEKELQSRSSVYKDLPGGCGDSWGEGSDLRNVPGCGGQIQAEEKSHAVNWSRFSAVRRLENNVPAAVLVSQM